MVAAFSAIAARIRAGGRRERPDRSWLSRHQTTLIIFLLGQLLVIGQGAASGFAYMVKLETGPHHGDTQR